MRGVLNTDQDSPDQISTKLKEKTMPICPGCKGSGKLTINSTYNGVPQKPVVIDCIECQGSGEVTREKLQVIKREAEMWCRCGADFGDSYYVDDNVDQECSKHHWRCNQCHKITQVG